MNKTLLTIIEDESRASMYELLMRKAGIEVVHADGALHALTQLERLTIDALICEADMEDMTGEELRAVIAEDSKMAHVPIFILPNPNFLAGKSSLEDTAPAGPQLLKHVLDRLGINEGIMPEIIQSEAEAQLEGDLSIFQLPELLNWVAEMRLQGHWMVCVEDKQGDTRMAHLYMKTGGDVVYAEYAGLVGRAALFALMRAIQIHPKATFRFIKKEQALPLCPSDLTKSTARLLIELAVELDHMQASHPH